MTSSPDWKRAAELRPDELDRLLEEDHDNVDDNPPATPEQLAAALPGKRRPGQRGPGKRPAKVLLTVRVDPSILEAWRSTGPGWQARVNELLTREAPETER